MTPFSIPSLTYNIVEEKLINEIGIYSSKLDFNIKMSQFDNDQMVVKPVPEPEPEIQS